jgi:asparaginyl-tRNA synthetase
LAVAADDVVRKDEQGESESARKKRAKKRKSERFAVEKPKQSFFKRQSYLSVSGQLHAECMAMALSKVYTFGPTFRADPSSTAHHLAEFWMLEPEMAFADLSDAMALAEQLVADSCRRALGGSDVRALAEQRDVGDGDAHLARLERCADGAFERISYTDAIDLVGARWGDDLLREHERFLTDTHFKGAPVFVTDYPRAIKPFYMRANDDGRTASCMDLLLPGLGEVAGGSAREDRLDQLHAQMDERQLERAELDWYADLRRYGSAPHAGFGIGFDRLVQFISGMSNIRDCIPFPRSKGRCDL